MKCPFCQQELKRFNEPHNKCAVWVCKNYNDPDNVCVAGGYLLNDDMLNFIYDTKKKLDIAVDALKVYSSESGNWWYGYEFQGNYEDCAGEYADKSLKQIKDNDKDVK